MEVITTIVSIVTLLCSCNGSIKELCNPCKLKKHKQALKTAMEVLKDTRDDVERRVEEKEGNPNQPTKRTHQVHGWLQRVQAMEGEVSLILEEADDLVQSQGACFGGGGGHCNNPRNGWSSYKHGKLMIQKLESVKELRRQGSFGDDNLTYGLPPPIVQQMPIDPPVGMESMLGRIWELLSSCKDDVGIIGLYGPGGVGKTTLLKQINNELLNSTIADTYDVVIFVVASGVLNIKAIQMKVGERLGLSFQEDDDKDERKRAEEIFNILIKKNFVLLLDDIWERVDLRRLGVPHVENKSKVIFTTRSETVCGLMEANRKMKVEYLPWTQAWNLFQEKVGKDALTSHPKVPELAELVAKQCGGLPLVLITIGRAMFTKKTLQQWNHAITTLTKSPSKFPGMSDTILPLLMLSYDNLSETLKSCFLYCSLYPEDHSIDIAELIDFWIGEGFIKEIDDIAEARDQGYELIGSLKDACLLECGEHNQETEVKMHDVIRDLAMWISSDFGREPDNYLVILGVEVSSTFDRWRKAKRVYLDSHTDIIGLRTPPESPNLLSLIVHRYSYLPKIISKFFQFMPLLRVLDLSCWKLEEFPASITELIELQFLNLSRTSIRELPYALSKLVKLKWLDLNVTYELAKVPAGLIASLGELRVLKMDRSFVGWDLAEEFASITELSDLKHLNHLEIGINNLVALEKFSSDQKSQNCTRVLRIAKCNNLKSIVFSLSPSSRTLSLGGLKSLRTMEFSGCLDLEDLRMDGVLAEGGLQNYKLLCNLETLELENLPKLSRVTLARQRRYLCSSSSFPHSISFIRVDACPALKDLSWLAYAENLETLRLWRCEGMEEIITCDDEKQIKNYYIFKRLKLIDLEFLPNLRSVCKHALALPLLERISIDRCPELKKLPLDSGSNVNNTLQTIGGYWKWWDALQWENEDVKSKFLPCFNKLV